MNNEVNDSPIYGLIHVSAFIHHTSTCEECDELPMPQSCRRYSRLFICQKNFAVLMGQKCSIRRVDAILAPLFPA
ncbi:hypothetical protein PHYBLDRAFT_147812 [Phycomyces blakesleeanus NRRL 1555(-)]|uniref:Uncharacterized protein n=1 Tax=Phycomyces blakesleeanus (strain ATCC 8743b / DSM 1359 / FGSC 10004 / NBRC 33097 / NRRL 1555) TaxID=763407 RepID=A0A162U0C0_PHYB8|nr:hypothetical protein PHYBLDRAFT_147801 [Phycomyces blakesleeanus NRRL 1555(-)]XP_018289359.1 hypothetical protein PHYBLDRAFT_147812 [Phycomyces blakesleeanus NRRL 1555(-)]OAD71303.1 hypothetical protein PHYBLDRAFT_147801 [Phycomyces blakesleeanus NRRL 1555(-)]OAD71319.1 hypothetical protein PHYBLDRAFT_147812 [Phycomyces blakesleeanus NRRL 1555(-)]|eukprot:XP_018289343.1 hypothetical protein PHYBLDRAFT_147801 [Phycomyces blakesleeanus NRRL 1555(-)]